MKGGVVNGEAALSVIDQNMGHDFQIHPDQQLLLFCPNNPLATRKINLAPHPPNLGITEVMKARSSLEAMRLTQEVYNYQRN